MSPDPMPQPERAHILLVEDDVQMRALLAETLREAELHVIEAANADEAWTYLESGAPVDLMFTDVQMPGSMDGQELARRVNAAYPQIRIVLTSGKRAKRPEHMPGLFLSKPYPRERALAVIFGVLGQADPK